MKCKVKNLLFYMEGKKKKKKIRKEEEENKRKRGEGRGGVSFAVDLFK